MEITAKQIKQILSTYVKYDWSLRSVLLTNELHAALEKESKDLFGNVEISISNVDAAWFSRPSVQNREAWELRHLSENAFALVETFDVDESEENRIKTCKEMETRLAKTLS